jgi:hypothetical protein
MVVKMVVELIATLSEHARYSERHSQKSFR